MRKLLHNVNVQRLCNRIGALGLLTSTFVAGCGSQLDAMADHELQDKVYECRRATDLAPGAAIACDNYERECLRRRQDGRFVC